MEKLKGAEGAATWTGEAVIAAKRVRGKVGEER